MLTCLVTLLTLWVTGEAAAQQPNIIFIVADDLGYNDISWHNPDILSPRLAELAAQGVILERSYVQPLCTPTRSALMTGRYPYHLGRQHGVLTPLMPTGLTLNQTLLPELLGAAGYRTHIVGKWHLGFCAAEYLPVARGFQTHLGYWNGMEDYYNHSRDSGLDFRDGGKPAPQYDGKYSAEVYAERAEQIITEHDPNEPLFLYLPFQSVHSPVQVPSEYEDLYPNIKNDGRRIFSGMVSALDDAVGRVVEALKTNDLYNNSVIVFISDNGGNPLPNASGNNFPLRGTKMTNWEGGTRTPAFVHSPLLQKTGYVSQEMMHVTDWLPTLLKIAGIDSFGGDIDGVDQWAMLSEGAPSARREIVYNIDDASGFAAAIRVGDLKLLWGDNSQASGWYPVPKSLSDAEPLNSSAFDDFPAEQLGLSAAVGGLGNLRDLPVHLFNVTADPTEHEDLAEQMPEAVKQLQDRLTELMKTMVPADIPPNDNAGMPQDGVWFSGWCQAK